MWDAECESASSGAVAFRGRLIASFRVLISDCPTTPRRNQRLDNWSRRRAVGRPRQQTDLRFQVEGSEEPRPNATFSEIAGLAFPPSTGLEKLRDHLPSMSGGDRFNRTEETRQRRNIAHQEVRKKRGTSLPPRDEIVNHR